MEYFCAYHSYLSSMELLTDAEKGRLFEALLQYSATGDVPEMPGNERFVFPSLKAQIDRDAQKYEEKCVKQAQNARKRWHAVGCDGMPTMPTDANDAKEKEKEKEKAKAKAKEKEKENKGGVGGGPQRRTSRRAPALHPRTKAP